MGKKVNKWMRWDDIESSNISGMAFLLTNTVEDLGILKVTFKKGQVYSYNDVPKNLVLEVVKAESVGKAFNTLIKPHYPGIKYE